MVDQPDAWAKEHRWLLDAIFEVFDRNGKWPKIEQLQRRLAGDPRRAAEIPQLGIDISRELGARHVDRFVLTTRALAHCPAAERLLEQFVAGIRLAVTVYEEGDEEHPAILSGLALKSSLELDEPSYRKVSQLLFAEPWFFPGGGGVDADWRLNVRAEMLLARSATNIRDYLETVARYRFGDAGGPTTQTPRFADGLIGTAKAWLDKRELTVRDYLLVTIVSAVIAGLVLWLVLG